jgi:diaminohydroxyphosphoribosylaminopyrimidine deaminase/5-amino-6-(5-phosphoribosylamino)uracil reductase
MFTADDARHMARALLLARRGLYTTDPNPRVGCVLVLDGLVIGEGWHERAGEPHAEVHALREAGARADGATAYVTLEPCCHHGRTPPCTQALIDAGVKRVVAGMHDPNPRVAGEGANQLRAAGVQVNVGLMEAEAEQLNPGFLKRMRDGRPFVRVKLAVSLDGRTALAGGESQWITGEAARRDVQRWRARSSAILTGVSTVLADDPQMNVRDIANAKQPLRIVLDSQLRMPPQAQMLKLPGRTLVVTASADPKRAQALRNAGAEIEVFAAGHGQVDLHALMQHLAARELNEILVESGARLAGGLLQAGLIDELVVYSAPSILGHDARGMFSLPPLQSMAERIALTIVDRRAVGQDWRVMARVAQ